MNKLIPIILILTTLNAYPNTNTVNRLNRLKNKYPIRYEELLQENYSNTIQKITQQSNINVNNLPPEKLLKIKKYAENLTIKELEFIEYNENEYNKHIREEEYNKLTKRRIKESEYWDKVYNRNLNNTDNNNNRTNRYKQYKQYKRNKRNKRQEFINNRDKYIKGPLHKNPKPNNPKRKPKRPGYIYSKCLQRYITIEHYEELKKTRIPKKDKSKTLKQLRKRALRKSKVTYKR